MRIAQIAPLWYPIPPARYGGTERVISTLTEELVKLGHDVTLFASGDSKTSAKLVATQPVSLVEAGIPWRDSFANNYNVVAAMEMADQFDIIHSHMHLNAAFFSKFVKTPILHTMHNIPGSKDWRWNLFRHYKYIYNPVFISQKQKDNAFKYAGIDYRNSYVVHNSVDPEIFQFNANPGDYFVWLGLITKVKGIENAIAAAKQAGVKLKLAGKQNEHNTVYFDTVIKPLLDENVEFVGELGGNDLVDFYQNAKALIYPIEWEEPFGLVMAESLACGTPVIAFRKGAVPEIIEDGKNGFIVDDIAGVCEAIKKIDQIDRDYCRQVAVKKFNPQAMAQSYIQIYEDLTR